MGGFSDKCPHCGKWYTNRGALGDHIKSHGEKAFAKMRLNAELPLASSNPTPLYDPSVAEQITETGRLLVGDIAAFVDRMMELTIPVAPMCFLPVTAPEELAVGDAIGVGPDGKLRKARVGDHFLGALPEGFSIRGDMLCIPESVALASGFGLRR